MRADVKPVPFKQTDLKKCALCDRGMMHPENSMGLFWRLKIERLIVDPRAVQRQHGLELVLGGGNGGGRIAQVMGPNEDLAKTISGPHDVLICEACVTEKMVALFMIDESKDEAGGKETTQGNAVDHHMPGGGMSEEV